MMVWYADWNRPGLSVSQFLIQQPGDFHPGFARVQHCHLNVQGRPPAPRAEGQAGPWPVVAFTSAAPDWARDV